MARREVARRSGSAIVARVTEAIVGPARGASVRTAGSRPITKWPIRAATVAEGAVAPRSITKGPVATVGALRRPVVARVERRATVGAAAFALFGAIGCAVRAGVVARVVVTRAIMAWAFIATPVATGTVSPRRSTVVRAAVHGAAIIVAARATGLERPIIPGAVAEAAWPRAAVARAGPEAVVGAKPAAPIRPTAAEAGAAVTVSAAGPLAATVATAATGKAAAAFHPLAAIRRAGTVRPVATGTKAARCAAVAVARRAEAFFALGPVFVGLGQGRTFHAGGSHRFAVRVASRGRAGFFLQGDRGHDDDEAAVCGRGQK
jgi:hypothetical protein